MCKNVAYENVLSLTFFVIEWCSNGGFTISNSCVDCPSLCKRRTVILTIFYVFSFDFAHFGAQTEFFLDRIEKIMCNFLVEV